MLQAKPTLLVSDNDILKILKGMDFDSVFTVVRGGGTDGADFQEIQPVTAGEKEMIGHILAAHRTLMSMSAENREKFEQVIKVFEKNIFQHPDLNQAKPETPDINS
jgi:hypothetical protein